MLGVLPDHGLVVVHRVDTDRRFSIEWPEIKELSGMTVAELDLLGAGHSAEGQWHRHDEFARDASYR